jgi:hypothetical protein
MWRPTWLLVIAAAVLVGAITTMVLIVLFIGVEGDSTHDHVAQAVAGYQAQVPFPIVVPSYLPRGTSRDPQMYPESGTILLQFPISSEAIAAPAEVAFVTIVESSHHDSSGVFPDPATEYRTLNGTAVGIIRRAGPADQVAVQVFGNVGDIYVSAALSWREPAPGQKITLSSDMEDQAFQVFESMLH